MNESHRTDRRISSRSLERDLSMVRTIIHNGIAGMIFLVLETLLLLCFRTGRLTISPILYVYFFIIWNLFDLTIGSYERKPKMMKIAMCVAPFLNFERTRKGASLRLGGWRKRRTFYISLFVAISRRNEQPATVNIIFSSP